MTEKELLYIEDVLGHLKHLVYLCNIYKQDIKDVNLKVFLKNYETINQNLENEFINLLQGGALYGR